ncbi:hypothetical protein GF389_00565 [Candidatus Dojkabacteria bacterium]|nr:hypothetical protein [Candidatus Dojkabacteria bacterium]
MQTILIGLSTILGLLAALVYAWAILRGQARPHRTTRVVLLVIGSVSFLSLLAQGDQVAVWLAGGAFLFSVVIFILSLKYGMGGWAKIDILSLIIAIVGIVLWQITNDPILALYLSIGADLAGMVPAMVKTYHLPKTESAPVFFLFAVASLLNILAVESWTVEEIAFPGYLLVVNLVMVGLILRPMIDRYT